MQKKEKDNFSLKFKEYMRIHKVPNPMSQATLYSLLDKMVRSEKFSFEMEFSA